MKPWTGLAALLTLLALAFFITAASVSVWTEYEQNQVVTHTGPFKVCRSIGGVLGCKSVGEDCTAIFEGAEGGAGGGAGAQTIMVGDSCNKVRTVRAFIILSIIFTAFAFVAFWIAAHSVDAAWISRMLGIILAFLGAICGIITMAVWISSQSTPVEQPQRNREYGYAFALVIASWIALLLASCMSLLPSPADLANTSAGSTLAGGMSRMLGGPRAGAPHYAGAGYGGTPAGAGANV